MINLSAKSCWVISLLALKNLMLSENIDIVINCNSKNRLNVYKCNYVCIMNRAIVHMDLDAFFVSCERLQNTELQRIPLIIGGGDRGVVASCSYEARRF